MAWHDSNVVRCDWEKTAAGYRLWVKRHAEIAGQAVDFETAQSMLIESIMRAAPDLDAVLPVVPEFDPPIPVEPGVQEYLNPELFLICGDAIFDAPRNPEESSAADELIYTNGTCPACGAARGCRTDVRIKIQSGDYADAGFVRGYGHPAPQVFSDRFCALLGDQEQRMFDLRPVEFPSRRRGRKYFELIAEPTTPLVSIKGLDADGCECPKCGWRSLSVLDPVLNAPPNYLSKFISRSDLPADAPSMFAVASSRDWSLCVTAVRLAELMSSPGSKGLSSTRLGVVNEADCERHPRLARRGLRTDCPVCSKWPKSTDIMGKPRACFSSEDIPASRLNWEWLASAELDGLVRIMRQTRPIAEIIALSDERPGRPELFSFRCPECWRLGSIQLKRRELWFTW